MAIKHSIERTSIKIFLWGDEIGTLVWKKEKKQGYLIFSNRYFELPYDLCPLTCAKSSPESRQAIYGEPETSPDTNVRIFKGLPPFIADSLPDQWGNEIFNRWFESRKLPESEKTPITKLAFIGNRAMGALEFRPMLDTKFYKDQIVNIDELYRESLEIEKKLSGIQIDKGNEVTTETIAALGSSPGGSRKKALIAIAPDGSIHPGQIPAREGWKEYIIKFNNPKYSTAEIEKTYYDLAIEAGIKMKPSFLMNVSGICHFLTERFDRKEGRKIFMQTLAAIYPDASTYEDLFLVCRRLGINEKEQTDLFRQAAFNFLMNNTDDHKKNFSFMLDEKFCWHLTPAYDITFIFQNESLTPETNHCMSLRGKYSGITDDDLITFARENGIKAPERIIKDIRKASLLFEEKAEMNGLGGLIREIISKRLNQLGRKQNFTEIEHRILTLNDNKIENLRFELSQKGNIHVYATIDSKPQKIVIESKKKLNEKIIKCGFEHLTPDLLKQIFDKHLNKKIGSPDL